MDRAFRSGHLDVDFAVPPFTSPIPLLMDSLRLFTATLPFLLTTTLGVFLPGKLAVHFACYLLDIPPEGILSYFVLEAGDLLLGALVIPAMVFGLVQYCRKGQTASLSESLRWGRRQWLRTAGNKIKVEVTVMLWGALLIIPGVVASIRLIFTDVIVAIEGDGQADPLRRSRELARGRGWLIFFTVLPLMLLSLLGMFLVMETTKAVEHSRIGFALADTALSILEQFGTVAILQMYLGLVQQSITKLKP